MVVVAHISPDGIRVLQDEQPTQVCAWCQRVIRYGGKPVSHGMCKTCAKTWDPEPAA